MHEYDEAYYFSRFHCLLTRYHFIIILGASGEICAIHVYNHVLSNRFGDGMCSILFIFFRIMFCCVTPTIFSRIGLGKSFVIQFVYLLLDV